MARFPIQRAPEKLGVVPTTAVRAAIDVRAGGQELAQAVSGLGRTIFDIGLEEKQRQLEEKQRQEKIAAKRQQMLDVRSAITADSLITTAIKENYAFRGTNADPLTWGKDLQERFNRANSEIALLDMSEDAKLLQQAKFQAKFDVAMAESLVAETRREVEDTRAAIINNVVEAYTSGTKQDQEEAGKRFIETAKGIMDDAEMRATLKTAIIAGKKAGIDVTRQKIWAIATKNVRQDGEVDWPAAVKWFSQKENIKDIDPKVIDSLLEDARTQANAQKTRDEIKQQRIDDEWTGIFSERLRFFLEPKQGEAPTFTEIDDSPMSNDAKSRMRTKVMTFDNYSEGELKEAFTDKGEVLADIYDKIDNGTLTDELDTMVGKGLSPLTAERIKKEIRVPYEKDTEQLFKRLFGWSPELGFPDNMSAWLYEKSLREWQAEVKKQDATGEKIIEIGRSVVRSYFIEKITKEVPFEDIPRIIELALGKSEEIEEKELKPPMPTKPEELEAELPSPKTKAEYDVLPSGARYFAPDGIERTKK